MTTTAPILIVAFDGLQPAQVAPHLMPNLARFAEEGVSCTNHHAVFPTVTRANAASIVTGHHPGAHGLTANTLVIPEFDPHRAVGALEPLLSQVAATHPVLLRPTLGDILRRSGMEYIAVGTGTSGNAYLQNPNAQSGGGMTIHPDFTLPRNLHGEINQRFGQWPDPGGPTANKMAHAVDIFTDYVLAERRPAASMLWLTEPDSSQHAHGVGSREAVAAIHEADRQFGRLLHRMELDGSLSDSNIMIISDHGYSSISDVIDVEAEVRAAGFPPGGEDGGVAVATNGGCALFYVTGSANRTADQLAEWLTSRPWCGALLASEAVGEISRALPASLIGLEGPRAPSLTMSFRWDSTINSAGFAGHAFSTNLGPGKGQHGSMSPHETQNVLFARGPAFKGGTTVGTPTGNVDIAPTVLHLLGVAGDEGMHGRVLSELLHGGPETIDWTREEHEAEGVTAAGTFRQRISLTRVGGTVYVDKGSGWLESG